jgi:LCP family protein required for cell wall assembly
MPLPSRRTWPQRLTFVFVLLCALACFATASALAVGQWVLSQRNLVVVDGATDAFEPDAGSTDVLMPGETTTTLATPGAGQTVTTTTMPLAEPDAANFLITGADNGACADQDDPTIGNRSSIGERSDTIMLWRVNPKVNQVAVLSFPRDLYVDLPGGRKGRINEAYERNDPTRLINTLNRNFGVPVDHYVQIDFCAFRQIVDAVGGVGVPFEYPAQDERSGLVIADTGCVELDGDTALAYVRSRHYEYEDPPGSGNWKTDGTSDIGRIARQQDFLRRMVAKVVNERLYSPDVASALISANAEYVVTDTELTLRRMLEFANTLRALDPTSLTTYRVDARSETTAAGESVLIPRIGGDDMQAILAVFRGEATIASAPQQGDDSTEGSSPTTTAPDEDPDVGGTTTLPRVAVEDNASGISPPDDVYCD